MGKLFRMEVSETVHSGAIAKTQNNLLNLEKKMVMIINRSADRKLQAYPSDV